MKSNQELAPHCLTLFHLIVSERKKLLEFWSKDIFSKSNICMIDRWLNKARQFFHIHGEKTKKDIIEKWRQTVSNVELSWLLAVTTNAIKTFKSLAVCLVKLEDGR